MAEVPKEVAWRVMECPCGGDAGTQASPAAKVLHAAAREAVAGQQPVHVDLKGATLSSKGDAPAFEALIALLDSEGKATVKISNGAIELSCKDGAMCISRKLVILDRVTINETGKRHSEAWPLLMFVQTGTMLRMSNCTLSAASGSPNLVHIKVLEDASMEVSGCSFKAVGVMAMGKLSMSSCSIRDASRGALTAVPGCVMDVRGTKIKDCHMGVVVGAEPHPDAVQPISVVLTQCTITCQQCGVCVDDPRATVTLDRCFIEGATKGTCVSVPAGKLKVSKGVYATTSWTCEGIILESSKASAELDGAALHMAKASTGLTLMDGATATASGCTFATNTTKPQGTAVSLEGSDRRHACSITLQRCEFAQLSQALSIHGHCSAVLQGCSMDGAHVGINAGEDIASADIRYEGCWIGPPGQTWVPSSQQMFPSEGWAQLQQAVRGVKVQVSNPAASAGAALGRAPQAQQLISAYTSGRSTEYVGSGPVLRDLLSSLTPEQMGMMTPEMAMQTMQALALTAGQGAAGGQPGASTTSGSTKQTSGRASCAACGAQPDKLQQCARCKVVKYCGRDCQTRDWPNHKLMCRQLAARQT